MKERTAHLLFHLTAWKTATIWCQREQRCRSFVDLANRKEIKLTKERQREARLWELLDGFSVAMVTTVDEGVLRSRPMAPFIDGDKKTIRFLTHRGSSKVDELQNDNRANLTFMSVGSNDYISVSGKLEPSDDRALIRSLWGAYADTWFEGGPQDPAIVALTMHVEQAEYWDGTLNVINAAWEIVQAYGSDTTPDIVDNGKVG